MSVSASTIPSTPWFGSGSISFSELRNNFKGSTSGSINASELIRYTSTSLRNPVVPDCTENSNVTSSRSNWKTSQFRNTIKYYNITQSGSDSNFNINQSWNGNVGKNIVKNAYITGTCTSSSVSSPAATFSATACNLTMRISGSILAAGGRGGSAGGGGGSTAVYTRRAVYRYYNPTTGDHFSTTGSAPSGYYSEGLQCYVFTQQAPGTIPIYDDDDGDRSNSGRPYSGVMGYAYPSSQPNTTPIYALTNGFDTMWSILSNEGASVGYSLLRTEFYAPTTDLVTVVYSGGNGENGGTALSINASGSNNLVVNTSGSARVYGGGGGGGGGGKGGKGGNGSYTTYYSYYISIGGGSCSGCGSVYYQRCQRACQNVGGEWANNCYKHTSQGGQNCGGNPSDYWSAVCYSDDASQVASTTSCRKTVVGSNTYYTTGGAGGNGVSGGHGQQVRTSGQGYNSGQPGGAFAGNGGNSGRGGDGGDWGQRGQDGGDGVRGTNGNVSAAPNFGESDGPTRGGRGGAAGAALTGSGYSKSGTSSAYRGSN